MQAVTGVFVSQSHAERAVKTLQSTGVSSDKITLLTPGTIQSEAKSPPVDAGEQPGMGKVIGAVVGAASGVSGGSLLVAMLPGVGPVTAIGLLGAAIFGAAGAGVGAVAGGSLENLATEGLPEDEIFVYEDALRKGRSVVMVLADNAATSAHIGDLLTAEGAESIDAARHQWWIGLRSAEQEHYSASGRNFGGDEKFYRLGFEAALHARMRCKEFDQVSAEMESNLEDLQRQYPGVELAEAYTSGYRRGREYYQHLCDESKAA
ncbi:MAG: hypothetical protein WB952_01485 [Terriglobales bacterium]